MGSTYFFRDLQTIEMVCEHVLPEVKSHRFINIWSAGCASGPEPYTLALLIREKLGEINYQNVKIFATDFDPTDELGAVVRSGSYPEDELARVPRDICEKYFTADLERPGNYVISEEIRRSVEFQKHNLLTLNPLRNNFNLIMCKNVLLHFNKNERIEVIKMFYDALASGGYLITEQTQKMPQEVAGLFEQVTSNTQLFRKKILP